MRALIIDDDENIRKTTAMALQAMGHEPFSVETGGEALQQLDKTHFDVAFLDLRLNGQSGLDLLPELLNQDPGLEIVVFTAFASIETVVEARRRGAVGYLPKPFTPEQIRRVLARIIKARKLEDRAAELESRLSSDAPPSDLSSLDELETEHIRRVFAQPASMAEAAHILGLDSTTLKRKRPSL